MAKFAIKLFLVMVMVAIVIVGTSLVCYLIFRSALAVIIGATISTVLAIALSFLVTRNLKGSQEPKQPG